MTPVISPPRKHATAHAAERLFAQCPYASLRSLQCDFEDGRLVLCGSLPSYYLKAVAQTVARRVAGVREIENQIEVMEK